MVEVNWKTTSRTKNTAHLRVPRMVRQVPSKQRQTFYTNHVQEREKDWLMGRPIAMMMIALGSTQDAVLFGQFNIFINDLFIFNSTG
jgi:hypothetical protein